jgi:hypothetical protein
MTGDGRIVVDDGEESRHSGVQIVKPVPVSTAKLVKPVAVKVLRPIPKRITEQFYNEAFQEGLTLQETSKAAMLANEWHRRWTQQEEANHTMPENDFYEMNPSSSPTFPSQFEVIDIDRQGAKNPSLGDCDSSYDEEEEERLKRRRQLVERASEVAQVAQLPPAPGASSWSSNTSSLSSYMAPQVKRRFTGAVATYEDEHDDEGCYPTVVAPQPVRPLAVRPTPIRVNPLPPPSHHQDAAPHFTGIPHDITALREDTVSPMSCSPGASSLSSSLNDFNNNMATVLPASYEAVHVVEDDDYAQVMEEDAAVESSPAHGEIQQAKDNVLQSLASTKGDVDSEKFQATVDPLQKYFSKQELDTRPHVVGSDSIDGMWLTLSKPTFFGCLGENDNGDPMYTLGRMSFDMFSPTNLVCSLQGNFNPVEVVNAEDRMSMLDLVPKGLREEVESGETVLRTYHIVTAFTIEPSLAAYPDAPNRDVTRPIKGIMTTYGYSLPDPNTPNRHSIWFTGGRIEPNNDSVDIRGWKKLFSIHPPKHSFGEKAKLLAVKLLMGATVPEEMAEDGSMEYVFTRPLGGHGMAYMDVIYIDDSMRIVRGHRGTTFVFSRVPER